MKTDLRTYLPPSAADLNELETALEQPCGHEPSEEGFERLMAGVRACRELERWRSGAQAPSSLREMVATLARAHGVSEDEVGEGLPVGQRVWHRVLAARAEPWRVAARGYSILARRFGVRAEALKQAIRGTYQTFMQQSPGAHAQFARSNSRSRVRKEYSKQLAVAFEELRTKAAAHRAASSGDEQLHQFFQVLDQWMS